MKIGILTQPLVNNYGGLLQAWALQKVLMRLGHETIIIDRHHIRLNDYKLPRRIAIILKTKLYCLIGREERGLKLSDAQALTIRKNLIAFINRRYAGVSIPLYTEKTFRQYIFQNQFDGYVVGSDQVWRPRYSPSIGNYFLDFLPEDSKAKKVAYAASFGVDNWEYTDAQTSLLKPLAQKFDLITVRESSGVELLQNHFGCKATHVLDPTMLLDRDDYRTLIQNPVVPVERSSGNLFCYVLDNNTDLDALISRVQQKTGLKAFFCTSTHKPKTKDDLRHIDDCIIPPIEQWIKSFDDAEMVLTDSFHGTVFAIIFNKPFWVVANEDRGAARFSSLLSLFKLEDRFVTDAKNVDWTKPIDWAKVNKLRQQFSIKSSNMLKSTLQ